MKIILKNLMTGIRSVAEPVLIAVLALSCSDNHLINNSQYLSETEIAFKERKELAAKRDSALFSVFKLNLSLAQSEALKFLYAYMPLSDLADYNGDFFLANIDRSLQARSESKWGKEIPEDIFLHYILPCRVNNENLDSFRIVYYYELMERVKGKNIREAALEINHWCHEKVFYQPADIRTSAPLSTILSARGRCGEESTLAVAALRTVGIPARQVYTPRWAHSDDNHAWVEIWDNGEWHYMGACEPEPVLDRGWFTEPAKRAMLVHTKSFGASLGTENAINRYRNYTDVNNLAKYAVTKKIFVKVLDRNNIPIKDALVEYKLYNYAEFYSLAIVTTNENGLSQFETGLGDLLVWAHKDDSFDFKKISVAETDTVVLKPDNNEKRIGSFDLDLSVPPVLSVSSGPSKDLIDENEVRIKKGDMIRLNYIDSWMKSSEIRKLAISLKLDTLRAKRIISRSMGNYGEISSFLRETPDSVRNRAMSLLEVLPDKDLRDVRKNILSDHLMNTSFPAGLEYMARATDEADEKIFLEYILNPRISNEMLVAWRHYFLNKLPSGLVNYKSKDPLLIIQYLNDNIRIVDDENYYDTPLTPVGVNELKVSDRTSRAICFVAICRSVGIPSRLEPGRNTPQYYLNRKWNDVCFSDQEQPELKKGYLKLQSAEKKPVPEYYIQFTLARFENGRYNTLEYDFNRKVTDFKEELPLPPGKYMLVTGNRLNDSRILSNISFFDLSENEHRTIIVKTRKESSGKKIFGTINLLNVYSLLDNNDNYKISSNNKGVVIIWIDPDKEPTRHIFNELPVHKTELDAWGGKFIFLTTDTGHDISLLKQTLIGLPANSSFGIDNQMIVLRNNVKSILLPQINLPVTIVSDPDGNISFISSGYRIGIAGQILKSIRQ